MKQDCGLCMNGLTNCADSDPVALPQQKSFYSYIPNCPKSQKQRESTAGLYQNYFGFSGGDVKQPKNKGKMAAATKGFFAPGCGFQQWGL